MIKRHHTILFIFLFVAGVYLLTISPNINWRDSPEFAHISYSLGIAHPAGFPVYSLAAKLFTMLPFGSIAFKTNLFSLFSSAASILLIYLICFELLSLLSNSDDDGSIQVISIIIAAFLFINQICWQNSIIAEVYSFNMFFTLLIIYLLIRYDVTRSDAMMFVAAFLYGISSGNHATVAFFLPALITFFFLEVKEKRFSKFIIVCTFFMLGFSVYLYLPLRSLADPAYDWSNPETFKRFIMHITDRKTSYYHFAAFKDTKSIVTNLTNYLITLNKNLTVAGIFLSVIGALIAYKKKKSVFWLLSLILAANTLFFFDWNAGVQLPSYVCYIIFISLGLSSVYAWLNKRLPLSEKVKSGRLFVYIIMALLVFIGLSGYSQLTKANIHTGEDDFKRQFLKLPENSIVLASYLYFHNRYYQDILGLRRDLKVLGYGEILTPELSPSSGQKRYKDINFEACYHDTSNTAKMNAFINLNLKPGRRIFTEIISEFMGFERYIKYFDGMYFEIEKKKVDKLEKRDAKAIGENFNDMISRFIIDPDYKNDDEASFIYVENTINILDYLLHYGYLDSVLFMVDTLEKVFGSGFRDDLLDNERKNLKVLKGVAYIKKNELSLAEKHFLKMIEDDEHRYEAYNKLGFIYEYMKKDDKAIEYYNLAIKEAPYIADNYIRLFNLYEKNNEMKKAKDIYSKGVKSLYKDELKALYEKINKLNE